MILKFRTIFMELILREIEAEINSKPVETEITSFFCIVLCVGGRDVTNSDSSFVTERAFANVCGAEGNVNQHGCMLQKTKPKHKKQLWQNKK